jgi:hypothetical protein
MSQEPAPTRRRERSQRYPGVTLEEAIGLARFVEERGLEGLPASALAEALGFSNIKTNAFSARVSAARQFGLLSQDGDGYALTALAREVLHPVEAGALPAIRRRALLESPLYAELALRYAGKVVPETSALANLLYHHHGITASAKAQAAEVFVASARFAGALDADGRFHPDGVPRAEAAPAADRAEPAAPRETPKGGPKPQAGRVRLDLPLWDEDAGKTIRVRAPESISRASFERFLQAFRLHVRVEDEPGR